MSRAKKVWIVAEYWATKDTLEVAQSAFNEADAVGMEIDDGMLADGSSRFIDDKVLLKAYFEPTDGQKEQVQATLEHFFRECGIPCEPIQFSLLHEEDWQGNFVRSCTTFVVDPNIFIVPSFQIDEFLKTSAHELYIEMDPENAFGTGHHQTTKLCLKNIFTLVHQKSVSPDFSALDVGTGSGILAILMKKLKLPYVLATETDEEALITAQKNMAKNGVQVETLVVSEEHRYEKNRYDLVVANILASVLNAMAKNLAESLKARGKLILSGILREQQAAVIATFTQVGLTLVHEDTMDDWCALIFTKP